MKYHDTAPIVRVAPGIYSYLSPAALKELKRCLAIAYPRSTSQQKREYVTLACQPTAAARFVKHPHFKTNSA